MSNDERQFIDSVLIVKSCEKTTAEVLEDLEKSKVANKRKSMAELIKKDEKEDEKEAT